MAMDEAADFAAAGLSEMQDACTLCLRHRPAQKNCRGKAIPRLPSRAMVPFPSFQISASRPRLAGDANPAGILSCALSRALLFAFPFRFFSRISMTRQRRGRLLESPPPHCQAQPSVTYSRCPQPAHSSSDPTERRGMDGSLALRSRSIIYATNAIAGRDPDHHQPDGVRASVHACTVAGRRRSCWGECMRCGKQMGGPTFRRADPSGETSRAALLQGTGTKFALHVRTNVRALV
jgi:hypothetical protein